MLRVLGILAIASTALAPFARANGVRIVTPSGDQNFVEIQQAVDAATDGDVILVAEGQYDPFSIDGKALSVFAVDGADVVIGSSLLIQNLAADQTVTISGLRVLYAGDDVPAVELYNNQGHIRFQDCELGPGDTAGFWYCEILLPQDGKPGVVVDNCDGVAFVACHMDGGPGDNGDDDYVSCDGGQGGAALEVTASTIALYDCQLQAGQGGSVGYYGTGTGGTGIDCVSSFVFASGCAILGGPGGLSFEGPNGPGGDGAYLNAASVLVALDTEVLGHPGVTNGEDLTGPGTYDPLPGAARSTGSAAFAASDAALTVTFQGEPGEPVWMPTSLPLDLVFLPTLNGTWLTELPPRVRMPFLGVTDGAGARVGQVDLASLASGVYLTGIVLQGLTLAPAPQPLVVTGSQTTAAQAWGRGWIPRYGVLAGPRHVVAIDPSTMPDCNLNGINDFLELALGTTPDVDHDLIPDECDLPAITIHVDASAPAGGDGSAGAPFQTISEAVSVALNGNVVLVADGTYSGGANWANPGLRDIELRSANGSATCILDAAAIRMTQGLGVHGSRIEGFTIRNTGVAIDIDRPNVTVVDCVIEDCTTYGMRTGASSPNMTVEQVRIARCRNGVRLFADPLVLRDFTVVDCQDSGIWLSCTELLFVNGLVADNGGTGVLVLHQVPSITTNQFVNLTIVGSASFGLYVAAFPDPCTTLVANCIVRDNNTSGPAQIRLTQLHEPTVTIEHSNVLGGLAAIEYDNSSPSAVIWGPGNIDLDPLFAAPASGDYHLVVPSPCIDAGINRPAADVATDLDGNPRFVDVPTVPDTGTGIPPIVDMGPYEAP